MQTRPAAPPASRRELELALEMWRTRAKAADARCAYLEEVLSSIGAEAGAARPFAG